MEKREKEYPNKDLNYPYRRERQHKVYQCQKHSGKENFLYAENGGTVTLSSKAFLYVMRKKQLFENHTKEFRCLSSNKKVAAVRTRGKEKTKGTGKCVIYVFVKNGCRRKIKIKVKE